MMGVQTPEFTVGYIVKMFPRLSETFILNEILELEKLGVNVVIFSIKKPNEGKFHSQLSLLKARVFYLEGMETKKWINWLGDLWDEVAPVKDNLWPLIEEALAEKDISKLENVLQSAWIAGKARELNIKHFHAHFASLPSTLAYYASLISGIPFSFTAHAKDIFVYDMNDHQLAKKLPAAKFVVTVTRYNKDYILERAPQLSPDKIRVIHNGVDVASFMPEDELNREKNLVLAVGRLVPKKGFDTLLDACKILKDSGFDFRCVIAGDGVDASSLLQKQSELGLDAEVEFLGPKRHDEVAELMKKATITCLPCRIAEDGNRDALPTVLLEALACGLPVISTNISGIPEIVDSGTDGILVDPDDPVGLSEQIRRLMLSEELRSKFAKAGKNKAMKKFNLSTNVKTLMNLYLNSAK